MTTMISNQLVYQTPNFMRSRYCWLWRRGRAMLEMAQSHHQRQIGLIPFIYQKQFQCIIDYYDSPADEPPLYKH